MKKEKSVGAVVVKNYQVLLVYQWKGLWGFQKGHMELGETEVETALREVEEEVGLNIKIDERQRFEFSYDVSGMNIHKTVVLFLAKVAGGGEVTIQEAEITEARWVPFAEVDELLTFKEWKDVWKNIQKDVFGKLS